MDDVNTIAATHDAAVVEDAAQGVDAAYGGEALGTIGDIGCYSFHETKNFAAGEGGTLVVNDESYVERAEILRQKGTNYAQFQRGEVDRYTWVDAGSSYVPSELQTALAYTQLCRRSELQKARQQVYEAYQRVLEPLADAGHLVSPEIPTNCGTNYHLYHIRVGSESERDALIETLRSAGIGAASHYEPLHTAEKGREFGYEAGDLPTTERVARRLIRLPLYPDLTVDTCERIATEIASFFGATGLLSN
jgi:dTDP-4-amino-4,6-dideoxygalactose transaminase